MGSTVTPHVVPAILLGAAVRIVAEATMLAACDSVGVGLSPTLVLRLEAAKEVGARHSVLALELLGRGAGVDPTTGPG